MENSYPLIEFESEVAAGGTLRFPRHIAESIPEGITVTVRITLGGIPTSLRRRGITEDEIERISTIQLEQRNNVLRFLQTEGTLSGNKRFQQRSTTGKH